MSMMAFYLLFPDEAKQESRVVTPVNLGGLPGHTFLFTEFYCVDPGCDCRRVMFNVIDTKTQKQVATINHGFEPPKAPFEDERQTFLDPTNPQTEMSDALLDLFEDMIAKDEVYRERLRRHYQMWKAVVDDPLHPLHHKVRTEDHDDPDFRPAFPRQEPVRRQGPKLGPNDPVHVAAGRSSRSAVGSRSGAVLGMGKAGATSRLAQIAATFGLPKRFQQAFGLRVVRRKPESLFQSGLRGIRIALEENPSDENVGFGARPLVGGSAGEF